MPCVPLLMVGGLLLSRKALCRAASAAASRDAVPKPHPAHQRPRTQAKGQPHSPPAPPPSASMTPAIHAKLQQAHNKLLARPSRQEDTATMSARPSASKPAPKKGRAAAQPEPDAGLHIRAPTALPLYADHLASNFCLHSASFHLKEEISVMSDSVSTKCSID